MARRPKSVEEIPASEVRRMERLARSALTPVGLDQRCRAMLARVGGASRREAAEAVGRTYGVVGEWERRFLAAGFRGWLKDLHPAYHSRLPSVLRREAEVLHCVIGDAPPEGHDYWPQREVVKRLRVAKDFVEYVFDRYGLLGSDAAPPEEADKPGRVDGARKTLLEALESKRLKSMQGWSDKQEARFFRELSEGQAPETAAALAGLSRRQLEARLETDEEFAIEFHRLRAGPIKKIEESVRKAALGGFEANYESGENSAGSYTKGKYIEPSVKAAEFWLTNLSPGAWSKRPKEAEGAKGVTITIGLSDAPPLGCEPPAPEDFAEANGNGRPGKRPAPEG